MGGTFSKTQNVENEKERDEKHSIVATSAAGSPNKNKHIHSSPSSQQQPSLPTMLNNMSTSSLPSLRDAVADMKRAVGWSEDNDPLERDLRSLDPLGGSTKRRKRSDSSSTSSSSDDDMDDSTSQDSDSSDSDSNNNNQEKSRGNRAKRQKTRGTNNKDNVVDDSDIETSEAAAHEGNNNDEGEGQEPLPFETLPEKHQLSVLGKVESIIENVIVVVADTKTVNLSNPSSSSKDALPPSTSDIAAPDNPARILDSGTLVFFSDRTVLGRVFETFSSVKEPRYTVRLPSNNDSKFSRVTKGLVLYYTPTEEYSQFVFTKSLQAKGYDGEDDEDIEEGEEKVPDFSDDEKEAEYKKGNYHFNKNYHHHDHRQRHSSPRRSKEYDRHLHDDNRSDESRDGSSFYGRGKKPARGGTVRGRGRGRAAPSSAFRQPQHPYQRNWTDYNRDDSGGDRRGRGMPPNRGGAGSTGMRGNRGGYSKGPGGVSRSPDRLDYQDGGGGYSRGGYGNPSSRRYNPGYNNNSTGNSPDSNRGTGYNASSRRPYSSTSDYRGHNQRHGRQPHQQQQNYYGNNGGRTSSDVYDPSRPRYSSASGGNGGNRTGRPQSMNSEESMGYEYWMNNPSNYAAAAAAAAAAYYYPQSSGVGGYGENGAYAYDPSYYDMWNNYSSSTGYNNNNASDNTNANNMAYNSSGNMGAGSGGNNADAGDGSSQPQGGMSSSSQS